MKDITKMPRAQVVNGMMFGLRQALTAEQFEKLETVLLSMPDYDFYQLIAECVHKASQPEITGKAYFDMLRKLGTALGVNGENTALTRFPVEFLPAEENEAYWRDICAVGWRPSSCARRTSSCPFHPS